MLGLNIRPDRIVMRAADGAVASPIPGLREVEWKKYAVYALRRRNVSPSAGPTDTAILSEEDVKTIERLEESLLLKKTETEENKVTDVVVAARYDS